MSSQVISRATVSIPFVDLHAQYEAIANEVESAMLQSLRSTEYILGSEVARFEQEFATFCGGRFGIGLDSGLSALELTLRAYGIGPGDEVITAANSFVATALAISSTGAQPVLVDADPETFNINVDLIEPAISSKTKAIMPVHLYGQPADMDPIIALARRRGLRVIEDACQAHGARYKGRRVGALGDAAAFSFYPAKNLGAYGDGGVVVTNDEHLAEAVRMLRNYGQREKYEHLVRGYNRRLDTLQAAVLRVKLRHLDAWNHARRRHAERYQQLLVDSGVDLPSSSATSESIWHLFVVRSRERDRLRSWLADRGIGTGIHYPAPIHLQAAYRDLGYKRGDFPIAEKSSDEILSLPMYAELTPDLIEYVAEAILEFHSSPSDVRHVSARSGIAVAAD